MVAPPDDFPVPQGLRGARSEHRRRAAVSQARQLREVLENPAQRRSRLDLVLGRQRQREDRRRIVWVPDRDREIAVSNGELLVLTDSLSADGATAAIDAAGFSIEAVDCLRGRVSRLYRPDARRSDVDELRRELAARGVATSYLAAAPLQINVKTGKSTPEAAMQTPPTFTPTDAGSVVVALLDTGLSAEQRGDGWLTAAQPGSEADPLDDLPPDGLLDFSAGHGTFAAGIVQQLAPQAQLEVQRVVDGTGFVDEVTLACELVTLVERQLGQGTKQLVVNVSLGAETLDDVPPLALEVALDVIDDLQAEHGGEVLVVAAAGNEGHDRPCWPGAFDRVVAVSSVTEDGVGSDWASRGSWVDVSAIGEGVLSTFVEGPEDPALDPAPEDFPPSAWAVWTGTSFTAPQVAGAVAFIAQRDGTSLRLALQRLLRDARRLPGYGRVVELLP